MSPIGKGLVHIPNRKGAMRGLGLRIKSGQKKMPSACVARSRPPLGLTCTQIFLPPFGFSL